ncbi:hypothetical protein [Sulfurimonas sp.]|uniref:hypothetical protein n=1 Tax=Sulfurimonas sp. TaxID=2022749 RepID=UPI0025F391AD|nr:hypothetical protein [Sulfurimonas sp.]
MKYILTILTFSLLFIGCADKNAFSKFNMQVDQELSASSLQESKIKMGENVEGVFSAIYLNDVYPNVYTVNEYFYVYLYLKDKKEMYDTNTLDKIKLTMKLNGNLPVKIKKLDSNNKFSHLVSVNSKWRKYYLVAFKREVKNKINLVLETDLSSSEELTYQKDEE